MESIRPLVAWALLRRVAPTLHPAEVLAALGDVEVLLEASASALCAQLGKAPRVGEALASPEARVAAREEVERALSAEADLLPWDDARYPASLREIPTPPALLNLRGDVAALAGPCLAIVGSRDASPYGIDMARGLARALALAGFVVVSGGARGIDAAAHEGALSVGGVSVAVRGSGLDVDYPRGHRALFDGMAERGANVGEYGPGVLPQRHHFPRRNRIIAGLSLGVVVVEARERSGALVTARIALEQNREVFAVPGALDNPRSMGTNHLIQQGAKLVMGADDIIGEISGQLAPPRARAPVRSADHGEAERRIIKELQAGPRHVDELEVGAEVGPGQLTGLLLQLELDGWICPCPGGRYRLGAPNGAA